MPDTDHPTTKASKPSGDFQSLDAMIQRKQDHIDHVLIQRKGQAKSNEFDRIQLEHCALPDIDFANDIDVSTRFLGRSLDRPFLISSMTGGPARAEAINTHLAEAANELGLAMGVGSQRVALIGGGASKSEGKAGLEGRIRALIGKRPLFANLGAVQLREPAGTSMARRAVDSLEADALILHLNPMQEIMQQGGDINWQGVAERIGEIVSSIGVPVIVKEVGFGISENVACQLQDLGVAAIDVAGSGGTNFGLVEGARAEDQLYTDMSQLFANWGISTVDALVALQKSGRFSLPVIASGGIRHGLDAAKAIALGAGLVGQAGSVLQAALQSTDAVIDHFAVMERALRIAMFGVGAANLEQFRITSLTKID